MHFNYHIVVEFISIWKYVLFQLILSKQAQEVISILEWQQTLKCSKNLSKGRQKLIELRYLYYYININFQFFRHSSFRFQSQRRLKTYLIQSIIIRRVLVIEFIHILIYLFSFTSQSTDNIFINLIYKIQRPQKIFNLVTSTIMSLLNIIKFRYNYEQYLKHFVFCWNYISKS